MGSNHSTDTTEQLRNLINSDPKNIRKKFSTLFKEYDRDNSGTIDEDEVQKFIHDFLLIQELDVELEMIRMAANSIFSIADADDDGLLTKDEFLDCLLRFDEIEGNIAQQLMQKIGDPDEIIGNSQRTLAESQAKRVGGSV